MSALPPQFTILLQHKPPATISKAKKPPPSQPPKRSKMTIVKNVTTFNDVRLHAMRECPPVVVKGDKLQSEGLKMIKVKKSSSTGTGADAQTWSYNDTKFRVKFYTGFPPSQIDFTDWHGESVSDFCKGMDMLDVRYEYGAIDGGEKVVVQASSGSGVAGFGGSSRVSEGAAGNKKIVQVISKPLTKAQTNKLNQQSGQTTSGTITQPTIKPQQQKQKQKTTSILSSMSGESDITNTLLSSTSGSGNKNVNKVLRSALRLTMAKNAEVTKSQVRVTAIYLLESEVQKFGGGKSVKFDQSSTMRTLNSSSSCSSSGGEEIEFKGGYFDITYPKGKSEGRGNFVDEGVQVLTKSEVEGVVMLVYNSAVSSDKGNDGDGDDEFDNDNDELDNVPYPPLLRTLSPLSMSLLSPRTFWSLVYHYVLPPTSSTLEDCIKLIITEGRKGVDGGVCDFRFLEGRFKTLSVKGFDNKRQAEEALIEEKKRADNKNNKKGKKNDDDDKEEDGDEEVGVGVINEIEEFMIKSYDSNYTDNSNNTQQQATGDASSSNDTSSANMKTDDWTFTIPTDEDVDEIASILNALPNCSTLLPEDTRGKVVEGIMKHALNYIQLSTCDVDMLFESMSLNLKYDDVSDIVKKAQELTIQEVLFSIFDEDDDVFGVFSKAGISSIEQLTFYVDVEDVLFNSIQSCESESESESENKNGIELEHVRKYVQRAEIAKEVLGEWIELWQ